MKVAAGSIHVHCLVPGKAGAATGPLHQEISKLNTTETLT